MVVPKGPIAGPEMGRLRSVPDAAVVIEHDRIKWFGKASDLPEVPDDAELIEITLPAEFETQTRDAP